MVEESTLLKMPATQPTIDILPETAITTNMFLARVLTGEFAPGYSADIEPWPKSTDNKDLYDSSVDSVQNPQIFVIFHDTQAYPEYLITFQ